jgi:hypothetical protein
VSLPDAAEAIALAAEARRRGMLGGADEALAIGFHELVGGLSDEQLDRLLAAIRAERLGRIEDERARSASDWRR